MLATTAVTPSPDTPAIPSRPVRGWVRAVLGADARLHTGLRRTLWSGLMYVLLNVARLVGATQGYLPWSAALILLAYEAAFFGGIYTAQRSGSTLGLRDPAITFVQILLALSSLVLNYALVEASRTVAMPLLCMVLVFGMYRLTPGQILLAGGAAVGMLMLMLLFLWRHHDPALDIGLQALNVGLAAITLPVLAVVAQQVAGLRQRQVRQKAEMAEAIEQLNRLATRDVLTGLVNRRFMTQRLGEEMQRMARTRRGFCVALLDIDFFKRVNDTYGHAVGDAVLSGFAQQASEALRDPDAVSRWGGEEFLVLLPECSLATAARGVEGFLQRFDLVLPARDEQQAPQRVTFSAGLAMARPDESLEQVVQRADAALYAAKQGGRHRLVVAT